MNTTIWVIKRKCFITGKVKHMRTLPRNSDLSYIGRLIEKYNRIYDGNKQLQLIGY